MAMTKNNVSNAFPASAGLLNEAAKASGFQLLGHSYTSLPGIDVAFAHTKGVSADGKFAIVFLAPKSGMVKLVWLVRPPKSKAAPRKLKLVDWEAGTTQSVSIKYDVPPPRSGAREIRITSVHDEGNGHYTIDGEIKFSDGWHRFVFILIL